MSQKGTNSPCRPKRHAIQPLNDLETQIKGNRYKESKAATFDET